MKNKAGFGLMEVLAASVVLGFLIVGLMQLQKGNRESILRVRARDAANYVAQHVLDSLGALNLNTVIAEANDNNTDTVMHKEKYIYSFEGKPQLNKNTEAMKIDIPYNVIVLMEDKDGGNEDLTKQRIDTTRFTRARDGDNYIDEGKRNYAKNLKVMVSWDFKNSTQSITMSKVVR